MAEIVPFPAPEPFTYPPAVLASHNQSILDTLAALPFGHRDHDGLLTRARELDEQMIASPAWDMRDIVSRLRLLRRLLTDQEEIDPEAFPIRLLDATLRDLGVDDPTDEE